MTGRDLRDFSHSIGTNCEILFQDAQGNYHQITTAIKTRCEGEKAVLMETGQTLGSWELKTSKPPQELIDYIEKYYEEEDKK